MNPYIFREYDIRGVVADDFTDEVVELLGKGIGTYFREKNAQTISLSGDIRLSTPHLKLLIWVSCRHRSIITVCTSCRWMVPSKLPAVTIHPI